MIDRTWRVRPCIGISARQAHFGVEPQEMANSRRNTDLLGAAGVVARAIKAMKNSCPVYLLGAWDDRMADPGALVPPWELVPPESSGIIFRRIARVPFTTLKWRVFEDSGLKHSYARDLQPEDHEWIRPSGASPWPDPDDIAVVVVLDYDHGLLKIEQVLEGLGTYGGKHFLLRTKNPAKTNPCLTRLPWTVLLANRSDLRRISSHEFEVPCPSLRRRPRAGVTVDPKPRSTEAQVTTQHQEVTVHPELLSSLQKLADSVDRKLSPTHACLVKLDEEGALLHDFEQGNLTAFLPSFSSSKEAEDAIGAGDCLAARLALALRDNNDLVDACRDAVREARALCLRDSTRGATEYWYGYACHADEADKNAVRVEAVQGGTLKGALSDLANRRAFLETLREIRLHDGDWYLPKFLTLDRKLSEHVLRLRNSIEKYVRATKHSRPYVAAVCGAPGQGKSTLALALAEEVSDCELIESNVAQWNGIEDLYLLLERLRTARLRSRVPIAFIDEVDADVGSAKIYSKLLEPLWDGKYTVHGEKRDLGGAAIFVLAGSGKEWQTAEALLAPRSYDDAKLSDLVSRFCDIPVELPSLDSRKADAILLSARLFLKRFPTVKWMSRGLVRFFATAHFNFGPRSIGQVVDMFGPLADDEIVTLRDFRGNSEALRLHTPDELPPEGADKDTSDPMGIEN